MAMKWFILFLGLSGCGGQAYVDESREIGPDSGIPSPCLSTEYVQRMVENVRNPYRIEELADCRSMSEDDLTWCCPFKTP